MLIQTPFNPKVSIPLNKIAIGILKPVNIILTQEGVTVLPNPLNAPAVVISMQHKKL